MVSKLAVAVPPDGIILLTRKERGERSPLPAVSSLLYYFDINVGHGSQTPLISVAALSQYCTNSTLGDGPFFVTKNFLEI